MTQQVFIKNKKITNPMDTLIARHVSKAFPKIGELVTGTVVNAGKHEIIIDIPGLTTGVIRGWELIDASGEMTNIHVGDDVQATVMDLENEHGMMELSFRVAGHRKAWDRLRHLKEHNEVVEVNATEANKGGLIVEVGRILGFLPVSQLAPEHYPRVEGGNKSKIFEKLKELVGKKFNVKVIDINDTDEKLIVSEKAVEDDKNMHALEGYAVGDILELTISGIVDFGLFVEIPVMTKDESVKAVTVEGLIHISEVSWQRVDDLHSKFNVGDTIRTQIIEIKGGKVSLSIKRLLPDPWQEAAIHYSVGNVVTGTVTKMNEFGAFVELEHNIHGLAHISELSLSRANTDQEIVEVGKSYEFKIINMEPAEHRLGLSRKALFENSGKN